jgi:hypothetical protein
VEEPIADLSTAQPAADKLPPLGAAASEQHAAAPEDNAATPRYGRKDVVVAEHRIYHAELETCPLCHTALHKCHHLSWRKTVQTLAQNLFVSSRGSVCPHHPNLIYLSDTAARLSLPHSTYGLDVLVRIGYQRDYLRLTFARIHQHLPDHIQVSERHLANLYQDYRVLLACAERLDVDTLRAAVRQYGGLIFSIDGLEPEGGQPQLWVVREVLTGTLMAAGWIPRLNEDTLKDFLAPVAALDLPLLATLSDKQVALVKALAATWDNVPHQYCQAHYLSNAVDPLYKADEQMKTQLRKQVRAVAGPTLRQVQAQAKRNASTDGPTLVVTGLAANPPAELAELKVGADSATADNAAPCPLPQAGQPDSHVLSRPGVIVRQRQSSRSQPHASAAAATPSQTPGASQQSQTDQLVMAYASRLRGVLSRSGRKPFRLAGLHLYADLLALLSSLEVALTHLPDEPRLSCFAEAIRQALLAFEEQYVWLAEGYTWVLDISAILDAPLPQPSDAADGAPASTNAMPQTAVQAQLDAYLQRLQARTDLSAPLTAFRTHLVALTHRYAPGLFHSYHIPGLPRTNNDLESLFGALRRRTLCTVGPYRARQMLHDYGAWLLFEKVYDEQQQLERLHRVPLDDFRQERRRMHQHQASRTEDRRFRRQPQAYLANLEAQAAAIARLE